LIIDKKCKCISHCRKLSVLYNFEINCNTAYLKKMYNQVSAKKKMFENV
jgi:hypothetical protein